MHEASLLRDVGLSILGAAALGLPAFFLKLPLLLAYLVAGILLGPHLGLGLIRSAESISTLSEIGLVLLMFILGLEIDLRKLLQAGRAVLVNGVTQFLGCAALALLFFGALGYRIEGGRYELVYLMVACSLSSTLVVVKLLSDRMELDSLTSRISLGILVLQDLWAIAFLAVQPNLANLKVGLLAVSLGKAAVLVLASWALARYALPVIFKRAARQPEMMLVLAMAWCFGICGLAESLHLSLEMGGLVAGISIASFPYHAEIAARVSNLRDFFVTLFFVALGLQIPVPTREVLLLAGAIVAFVSVSRVLTVFPVLHRLGYGNRGSLIPALNLSQISEFSLVVAALGVGYGHLPQPMLSSFVLALVATVLLSSVLIPNGHRIYRALNGALERIGFRDAAAGGGAEPAEDSHARARIVLLGFFREASSLLEVLRQRHSSESLKELLVVDFNPEAHHRMKELGIACKYGDISHTDTLSHLGIENAEVLICTIPDHVLKGTSNLKLLRSLKELAPQARIIVTAESFESARSMYDEGAEYVFLPRIVSAQHLADVVERLQSGGGPVLKQGGREFLRNWSEVIP